MYATVKLTDGYHPKEKIVALCNRSQLIDHRICNRADKMDAGEI